MNHLGKLENGVPMDRILDDVRDAIHNSKSLTRTHLITKHELHNIKNQFNNNFVEWLSSQDTVSVELIIDEYKKKYGDRTPIRYYKPQGVEDEDGVFLKDDIVLILMDPTQIDVSFSILQIKYKCNFVCSDIFAYYFSI